MRSSLTMEPADQPRPKPLPARTSKRGSNFASLGLVVALAVLLVAMRVANFQSPRVELALWISLISAVALFALLTDSRKCWHYWMVSRAYGRNQTAKPSTTKAEMTTNMCFLAQSSFKATAIPTLQGRTVCQQSATAGCQGQKVESCFRILRLC